ncbi:hypothetical protein BCR24_13140 [Enterococcus ureilyticus]|uniref:WxL domain-containing protein n=1 Tax=Enterococcus ureilyticus TaxID=1131292 RepID=A0A1E5HDS1_9ENTE|nr:pectate lyase-like adhesive domain-containing protein [Enterococcus ureilyticus]MBM7689830.1 hypothetical protein [Enterococcus ureilyticus]OEG23091.1 hypothetical protein BCR24_13140 [Enterococcus ureilyticus]
MKIGKKSFFLGIVFLGMIVLFGFLGKQSLIKAEDAQTTEGNIATGEVDLTQFTGNEIREVQSWEQLIRAIDDTSVKAISITKSFETPDDPSISGTLNSISAGATSNANATANFRYLTRTGIARKLVIEGNNNTIDFRSLMIGFYNNTVTGTNGWDITWQNLNAYHGNYYGFTSYVDLSADNQRLSKLTFHNLKDTGSELLHSPYAQVYMSGTVENNMTQYYTSPFRTNWQINALGQANLEISNLTLMENANFKSNTINSGNIWLMNGGSLVLDKNSTMTVTTGPSNDWGEAYGQNLYVANGNVTLNEGATLNLNSPKGKTDWGSLDLYSANSKLTIGKKAVLNIKSDGRSSGGTGDARSIISMGGGSSLIVDEEGALNIEATNMGNSETDIIYASGDATFKVNKKGTFNILSDSTNPAQSLIRFATQGSTFQFADALRVNLQRTSVLNSGDSGLVRIGGTLGKLDVDIQKVNIWNLGILDGLPNRSWTPMYGMLINYSDINPTITKASSLTTANETSFKNPTTGFTTKNVQRVLYEYIPDVSVSILSKATDDITSTDSTTITGTTNPGAYVRLSDKPIVDSVGVLIDPAKNSVKSPVTSSGQDPLYTDNFTVQADASGNYSYTLPEGKHFSAGTTITAYSFLDGKTDTATQVVLDVTPPKGEPKEYHLGKGDARPDPSVFVQNPTDSNPVPQNFTYKYTAETLGEIDTLVGTVGEHEVKVIIMDDAKNETVVTSKLIVHETTNGIDAQDITVETNTIKDMTEAQLKAQILSQSNVSAHKIVDGVYTELTDNVQVTDLAGLSPSKTSGTYPVVLTVKAADSGLATDITKVIQVTVKLSEQNVKVQFVDESGVSLHENVTLKGSVGSTIDLTKEKQVTDAITSVLADRYLVETSGRPTNETAIPIGTEESTITYTFQGTLSIYSGPTEINFGSHEVSWKGTKDNNPSYDQPLVIWDNRKNLDNWKLSVKLEGELSMPDSPTHVLSGVLSYQTASDKKVLSTDAQDVLQAKHDASGQYDISTRTWGPDKQGLRLDVPSGAVKLTGEYETTLIWRVEEAY